MMSLSEKLTAQWKDAVNLVLSGDSLVAQRMAIAFEV